MLPKAQDKNAGIIEKVVAQLRNREARGAVIVAPGGSLLLSTMPRKNRRPQEQALSDH
jgi:hypothetical protein